jgi:DNA-binding GntR family transcriptional regulator
MLKKKVAKQAVREPGRSSSQAAYELLIAEIESGRLSPGSRLLEVELAERLGISRTPVREAINRLETQGLVSHEANQGAVITKLDHARTVELYVVREVLEGVAARLAAASATQAELDILQATMEEDWKYADVPEKLVIRDRLFHKQIQLTARNHFLNDILDNMRMSQILMTGTTLAVRARPTALLEEHQAIIDAIIARDTDRAEACARFHVRQAFAARLRLYADQQRDGI